jgi:hypothetical protein
MSFGLTTATSRSGYSTSLKEQSFSCPHYNYGVSWLGPRILITECVTLSAPGDVRYLTPLEQRAFALALRRSVTVIRAGRAHSP